MLKMSKDIVFIPPSIVDEKKLSAPTKIDTPDYPDYGVDYAGYSKKLQAGNSYRLSVQDLYDKQQTYGWVGTSTLLTLTSSIPNGKRVYVKKFSYSCYSNTACIFTFGAYDSTTAALTYVLLKVVCPANGFLSGNFELCVPYPMTMPSFGVQPDTNITGRFCINMSGWTEDNL